MLTWNRLDKKHGHWLCAKWSEPDVDLSDKLDEIQRWSNDNNCGKRMSYDMWLFNSEKEVTVFLLRWS